MDRISDEWFCGTDSFFLDISYCLAENCGVHSLGRVGTFMIMISIGIMWIVFSSVLVLSHCLKIGFL
jgi:hypothetical protein